MNAILRNAFVLGAGLGTRLKTLTSRKPKPLIPICGKPLISFAFDHLRRNGVQQFIVNTHHCPEAYDEAFPDVKYGDLPIHFEHEPVLLETAGGLKNAEQFLRNETFIVYNGDILSDLPIERAIEAHFRQRNEVTLVLRSAGAPLHISLDEASGRVVDIAGRLQSCTKPKFMFTGIYIVNPSFLFKVPSRTKISVIPVFLHMIQRTQKLGGIVIDAGHWWDLGTREKYLEVHRFLAQSDSDFVRGPDLEEWPQWIDPTAQISPSAKLEGVTSIGAGAVIGDDAELTDCVVWENAQVAPGAVLRECIVTAGQVASGTQTGFDF
ncbi:MAG: mannose-phosphate guanylyltransferase [Chthoniobacter sp.]|nr:mannose-phosphate guanylyltransferase [Chthoniobacter sp.]